MTKKPWLKSEERFLNENYPHMTATEISGHLGRSVMAVQQRAFVIGIQAVCRSGVKTEWTKKRVSFLKKNFKRFTTKELCNRLEIKDTVVRMKMKELGLRKYNQNK